LYFKVLVVKEIIFSKLEIIREVSSSKDTPKADEESIVWRI
jgi:hypothetical protein